MKIANETGREEMSGSETPEFDGECAFAMSLGKPGAVGSPNHALADGDKTYYFQNGVAKFLWKVLPNRVEKATSAWATPT